MVIKEVPMEVEKRWPLVPLLEHVSIAIRKVTKLVIAGLKVELAKVGSLVASATIVAKLGTELRIVGTKRKTKVSIRTGISPTKMEEVKQLLVQWMEHQNLYYVVWSFQTSLNFFWILMCGLLLLIWLACKM